MKKTKKQIIERRRDFLLAAASAAAGLTLAGCKATGGEGKENKEDKEGKEGEKEQGEAEVTPGEDLMQEHGVLERILLIYDEGARRLERSERFDLKVITDAAAIVERFIENYHEKLEEQFVFPRLQAANREVELVTVLLRQHERGREVTDQILRRADASASAGLAHALRSFVNMYRPHMAREDTVLFPAFRDVVGRAGYGELGEQFEGREHELLGEKGFENTVTEVARLETALGIADLAKFTP